MLLQQQQHRARVFDVQAAGSLQDQQKLQPEQKKGLNNCGPYLTRDLAPPSNYSEAKKNLQQLSFGLVSNRFNCF